MPFPLVKCNNIQKYYTSMVKNNLQPLAVLDFEIMRWNFCQSQSNSCTTTCSREEVPNFKTSSFGPPGIYGLNGIVHFNFIFNWPLCTNTYMNILDIHLQASTQLTIMDQNMVVNFQSKQCLRIHDFCGEYFFCYLSYT